MEKTKEYKFKAKIIKHPELDAGMIEFPYDVEKEFGVKGQVKVKAFFDGQEYRGSLVKMGHKCHWIGITQEMRKKVKKNPGDVIEVVITKDDEPRIVEVPTDIAKVLKKNPAANSAFEKMSFSHKKEYVKWITDAKKPETREKRLNSLGEKILESRTKK